MSEPKTFPQTPHAGLGLLEFTYRFIIVMLDNGLIKTPEALEMLNGVSDALEFGRITPGILKRLQDAMERSNVAHPG